MARADGLVRGAAALVRLAWIANRLFLVAVVIGIAATWVWPGFFAALFERADPGVDTVAALTGARLLMLIGVAMGIATDRLLVPLGAIIGTARAGEPFDPANAPRLRAMGWALLALQLLDIPATWLAVDWPSLGSAAPAGGVSLGGWMATLLLFVLARVFAAGADMRDDLAGTV